MTTCDQQNYGMLDIGMKDTIRTKMTILSLVYDEVEHVYNGGLKMELLLISLGTLHPSITEFLKG